MRGPTSPMVTLVTMLREAATYPAEALADLDFRLWQEVFRGFLKQRVSEWVITP